MKVLVTGGAGFIGSFIVDQLVEEEHDVVILDNLDEQVHDGRPDYLNEAARFVRGDVRNANDVAGVMDGVDVVFHQAAAVGVGQSMYDVSYYTGTNTDGTGVLWQDIIGNDRDVKKVVVASSMSIYGEGAYECEEHGIQYPEKRGTEQLEEGAWQHNCPECGETMEPVAITEEKPLQPTSVYAQTKRHQEEMTLLLGETYGIPAVALRYFNVYGPRQSLSNPYTGVASTFSSRIKNGNPPVIYEDGEQRRDFVYVEDVARANLLAMQESGADYNAVNIGSGSSIAIKDLTETLIELYKADMEPQITGEFRAGDIRDAFADISKAEELLGYTPQVDIEDGMRRLVAWAQDQEAEDRFEQAAEELADRDLVK